MRLYLNRFVAYNSICVGLQHLSLCSFNKGYYFWCCNISFSCDADVLQGCTYREINLSAHFCSTPVGTAIGLESVVVCEVGFSLDVYVCVCVWVYECETEAHALSRSLVPLHCSPLKENPQLGKTIRSKRMQTSCKSMTNIFLQFRGVRCIKRAQTGLDFRCHMISSQEKLHRVWRSAANVSWEDLQSVFMNKLILLSITVSYWRRNRNISTNNGLL